MNDPAKFKAWRSNSDEGETSSRDLVLDAAAALFSTQGYVETSLKQVAGAVGITQPSIYHHFKSKEEILTEILDLAITNVSRSVRDAVAAMEPKSTPAEVLLVAIEAHVRALYVNPSYTTTMTKCANQIPGDALRGALPARGRYKRFWRKLFMDAHEAGYLVLDANPALVHVFLLHSVNQTLAWYQPEHGSVDELTKIIVTAFSAFLSPKATARK